MIGLQESTGNTLEYFVLNDNSSDEYADIQHEMTPDSYHSIKDMAEMVSLMENEITDRYSALYELGKRNVRARSSTWQDRKETAVFLY